MALFGVPFESATYQTDAVLAALAIQRDWRAVSVRHARRHQHGHCDGGHAGATHKSLYDVIGDAVNLASRVEALCPLGAVTVSPSSEDVLKPWFQFDKLEEQEVKGHRMDGVSQCARAQIDCRG